MKRYDMIDIISISFVYICATLMTYNGVLTMYDLLGENPVTVIIGYTAYFVTWYLVHKGLNKKA